ncbi:MAG: PEP-CTERM sorting domain-containing protein [Rubrivivax sp.]
MHFIKQAILYIGAAIGAGALTALPLRAAVLKPDASVAGIDQATLSQNWWNWAVSYAPAVNPVTDLTGAYSSAGNQGSYVFLAGASTPDAVSRTVTVRNDQTLFFPILNSFAGYTDAEIANPGYTDSEIRTEATNYLGNVSGLYLKLDGVDLPMPAGSANLLAFRQPTDRFDLLIPSDNIFGAAAGTYRSFSDGYWVALSPLQIGSYELRFGGELAATGPFAGSTFSQNISYQITAVPEPAITMMLLAGLGVGAALSYRRREGQRTAPGKRCG